MKKHTRIGIIMLALSSLFGTPAMAWDANAESEAQATADAFKAEDPDLDAFFEKAVGYAIFPTVGKAAMGVGGARGTGVVFEGGEVIGDTTLTQLSIGFSLGGQSYSEIVFFEKDADLDAFKQGKFALDAAASAVALKKGASKNADYSEGVAIFTHPKGGLMFEVGVGGQKFSFTPK